MNNPTSQERLMCSKCGNPNPTEAAFCFNCGERIPKQPASGYKLTSGILHPPLPEAERATVDYPNQSELGSCSPDDAATPVKSPSIFKMVCLVFAGAISFVFSIGGLAGLLAGKGLGGLILLCLGFLGCGRCIKSAQKLDKRRAISAGDGELPFILEPGETLICATPRCQYIGTALITKTSSSGSAGAFGESHHVVGGFGGSRSQVVKRQGSFADAKRAYTYLTSGRLLVYDVGFLSIKPRFLIVEIELSQIKGLANCKKAWTLGIQFAIKNPQEGVDNVMLLLLGGGREAERDTMLGQIKNALNALPSASDVKPEIERKIANSSPFEELKKLADLKEQGIITEEEFETKKKQLLGLPVQGLK